MSTVDWVLRHYDIEGNPILAFSYDPDLSASSELRHAFDRNVTFNLNSYDELEFALYLDDPAAFNISRGRSVIKLFRSVDDDVYSKTLSGSSPSFAGVVTYTEKSGEENILRCKCYSPLWRLQTHFHILNHYLETNIETDEIYTQSELIWKLIDLVNEAFGGDSFTGISKGNFNWGLPDEPQIGPYFVGKGTNTWSNVFDDIMNRPGGPDIVPRYVHTNGNRRQMYLDTDEKRGVDRTGDTAFNYHTDPDDLVPNCDDMVEEEQLTPGEFGNYLWVVGQGGPNSGKVAARQNSSGADLSDGFDEIGVYMVLVDRDEVKRVDALSPIAEAEFQKRKNPVPSYSVQISPASGIYYDIDFSLGDVVPLNANKGALQVTNKKQRIYQASLAMSDNNFETATTLVSNDFFGKVEE